MPVDRALPPSVRRDVLRMAEHIVTKDRNIQYGDPEDEFANISLMWTAIFGVTVRPDQVALAMACLKIARANHNPTYPDSWIDLAGYAACGAEAAGAHMFEGGGA